MKVNSRYLARLQNKYLMKASMIKMIIKSLISSIIEFLTSLFSKPETQSKLKDLLLYVLSEIVDKFLFNKKTNEL